MKNEWMYAFKRLSLMTGSAIIFTVAVALSGCGSFTVLDHPEVEVRDEPTGKFVFEEVLPVSDCKSCHEKMANKYEGYARAAEKRTTSYDRVATANATEFKGLSNYAGSDYDYYYYYPWWFDGYSLTTGANSSAPAAGGSGNVSAAPANGSVRARQSFRRGMGAFRNPAAAGLYTPAPVSTPGTTTATPAARPAEPSGSTGSGATRKESPSGQNGGSTGTPSGGETRSRDSTSGTNTNSGNTGNTNTEEKRSSPRSR